MVHQNAGQYMRGLCKFMHHALLCSPALTQAVGEGTELPRWQRMLSGGTSEVPAKVLQSVLTVMASSCSQLTCLADSLWCMSRSFARVMDTPNVADKQQVGHQLSKDMAGFW